MRRITSNTEHDLTNYEHNKLDQAQRRLYRRALNLAPPHIAMEQGLEVVYNRELLEIPKYHITWSERVRTARARLLWESREAASQEPIRAVLFEEHSFIPRAWPGRSLPGVTRRRGNWLTTASEDFLRYKHNFLRL